ncbi:MAG: MarC family protein [Planctomycetes bacterium]|nr:MarC family protein [Planctomycetota bacterium]
MGEWVAERVMSFLMAFVPIFFAVDAPGVLPLYIGLTEGMESDVRRRVLRQSLITAFIVAAGFVFFGKTIFVLMGITVEDFMVAGGALLFIIAAMDLVTESKYTRRVPETVGAVPLGTPLIIGPATLTMALMLTGVYGLWETLAAVVVNILLAGVIFMGADTLTRLLGPAGSRALSKVAGLILAAIAVMMIRRGLAGALAAVAAKQP